MLRHTSARPLLGLAFQEHSSVCGATSIKSSSSWGSYHGFLERNCGAFQFRQQGMVVTLAHLILLGTLGMYIPSNWRH
jgi:hypothetical protein